MKAETTFSLKDQLFNKAKVDYLAGLISHAYRRFDSGGFTNAVMVEFPNLELKERIDHIATSLHDFLPSGYLKALDIIVRSLPPELDPTLTDDDFGDFIFSPLSLFVAKYGCSEKHLHRSLNAIREITRRSSAEFAIRFFINAFPQETLSFLTECASDEHYHVRRLSSEGTRPRLPWAQNVNISHTDALPILELLFADETRFVTRSVANHMNDISKIDPKLVITTLQAWSKSGLQDESEMSFITRHSLRTLVKRGDGTALRLVGFGTKPAVKVVGLKTTTPKVSVGNPFIFSFELQSQKRQKLLIDYTMRFATGGGGASEKVFQIKQIDAAKGETVVINKRHPMRLMTTRRLYTGRHEVILRVNGASFGSVSFELLE